MALTKVGKEGITGISNSSDATAITIDSSENVGIGTTTPGSYNSGADDLVIATTGATGITIASGTSNNGSLFFADGTSGADQYRGYIQYEQTNNAMAFGTNGAERMRIDSAGKVRIGTSSGVYTEQFLVQSDTSSVNPMTVNNTRSSAATDYAIIFGRNGSIVGSIQTSLSATSYVTSSDYRLKTNVSYDWDATSRLKQLKPARFDWISEGDDAVTVDGFLAHEAQAVVPEAVTGTKDAMRDEEYEIKPAVLDDDGNEVTPAEIGTRSVPDYQGIDQAKIVPLLVKTLQEAITKIETLEAKVQALEDA